MEQISRAPPIRNPLPFTTSGEFFALVVSPGGGPRDLYLVFEKDGSRRVRRVLGRHPNGRLILRRLPRGGTRALLALLDATGAAIPQNRLG